jgi:hypothetical protein
MSQIKNGEK